jgi:TolB-like protein/Flp pilus assembly protein TadD
VPDPSWRPPLLAGVAADQTALVAQGLYPILVMPFETDDNGEPVRKLADQITDDLIGDLARLPTVRVMSASTARLYRGRTVDVAAVGAELGVRYVLEGKIRRQDAALRVNVALVDTTSRLQVWTQRFDGDTSNWRDIQDQITRGLARRLHIALAVAAGRPDSPRNDRDAEIKELLAEGWRDMFRAPSAGISGEAERRFSAVLARDPDNGRAMIGLAASHLLIVADFAAHDPARHLALAETLLDRALDKSPEASIGHYFRGVLLKLQGKRQEAQAAFLRTLEINPSHAPAYGQLGHLLIQRGLIEEGFEHLRYALRLSPNDPLRPYWHLFAVHAEIALGHDAAAFDWARSALELAPRNPQVHVIMAGICGMRGDTACAANHAAEARRLAPALSMERLERRYGGLGRGEGGESFIRGLRGAFGT